MKVTGPGTSSGAPDVPDAEGDGSAPSPGATGAVDRSGESFADKLEAGGPQRVAAAGGAGPAGRAEALTADIAADLGAGKLGPEAALQRVVERVIDSQVGADAPAALRETLRAALRETLESDPFLAEKLRRIQDV